MNWQKHACLFANGKFQMLYNEVCMNNENKFDPKDMFTRQIEGLTEEQQDYNLPVRKITIDGKEIEYVSNGYAIAILKPEGLSFSEEVKLISKIHVENYKKVLK